MHHRRVPAGTSLLLASAVLLGGLAGGRASAEQALPAFGVSVAGLPETSLESSRSPVILEIQSGLARLGFYKGSIDGQFSIATGQAVRLYRKVHNLEGGPTEWDGLLAHLESQTREGAEIDSRLDRARRSQIKAAREILDQQVELQAMLNNAKKADGLAPPLTYDCLVVPNADCMFRTAMESAANVAREEYRNWALRDLIRALAIVGRYEEALGSLKKLTDPRLIFMALREVSEAMARSGQFDKALETARLIPEPAHRGRALIAVAGRLAETRQYLRARDMGDEALRFLAREGDVAERLITMAGFAEDIAAAGDTDYAARLLGVVESALGEAPDGAPRDAAWARLARARVALGDHASAIHALKRIENSHYRTGIGSGLNETAQQAAPGRAMQLLSTIDDVRYRVLALCDVAYSEFRTGDAARAMALIAQAERMVETVDSPYAGSFGRARIAETLLKLGRPDLATTMATGIGDDALRARALWTIAESRRAAGDAAAAERDEGRAIEAAASARSVFDRAVVLGDFAVSLARNGRAALARETYGNALQAARRINIDWWRARALAKAAGTLHELEAQGVY